MTTNMQEHCDSCGYELAEGQIGKCDDCQADSSRPRTITLNSQAEYDAVLAALRLLACVMSYPNGTTVSVAPDDGDIGDILTNSGEHAGLTSEQVHNIADRINS